VYYYLPPIKTKSIFVKYYLYVILAWVQGAGFRVLGHGRSMNYEL
jgi:hypothetical protein